MKKLKTIGIVDFIALSATLYSCKDRSTNEESIA